MGSAAADAKAASSLNGVYRFSISKEEAIAAGAGDDPDYPTTQTIWLEDGNWTMEGPEGRNPGGPYVVNGDEISFESPLDDVINTFTFTRDEAGNLTLEAVEPMDPGDRILMTTKTWTKIG